VVDETGVVAVYRKLHLWDGEKLLFAPGSAPPPVLDTRVGRVGVVICYDLEFPELTRAVALEGAQLLAVPTNWPLVPRPDGERPPEAVVAMAAARVNRMAVACADRMGTERGLEWTGGATIVGVDGWVAAETREPGLLVADLDLAPALDKRLTERADAFGDRRPELYGALSG
jgi:predicted amidohydrolase